MEKDRVYATLGLVVVGVAWILFVVSFATPYWLDLGVVYHSGLWQACTLGDCVSTTEAGGSMEMQVVECLALVAGVTALVVNVLRVAAPQRKLTILQACVTLTTVVLVVAALLIGSTQDTQGLPIGWSLYVHVACVPVYATATVVNIVEIFVLKPRAINPT